ncbi:MAG TPA: CPBP family intramembrane metalloprotease [Planctomycetes bacterium]|nr:CPBP family intramembrane metalloprotease [Planctomycetota bacterium]HIK83085.1 CPBP family intramembrane metalloprotease [Planctomycetota bacterium]
MTTPAGPRQVFRASLYFHGSMGVIALIGIYLSDHQKWMQEWIQDSPENILLGLLIGLVLGSVAALLSQILPLVWRDARQLESRLAELFEGSTPIEVLVLALISSVAEELLFRGLLQPFLGIFIASALFGLAHWTGDRRLCAWPLIALLAGLALGRLAQWPTAGLPGAIGAHFAVNWIGLNRLSRPLSPPASDPAG